MNIKLENFQSKALVFSSALLISSGVLAGNVASNFNPGDTLTATQMTEIKDAVNDNDSRVSTLESNSDADTVDGFHANQIVRASYALDTVFINDFSSSTNVSILTTSVTAPTDGIILVWATINAEWDVSSTADTFADLISQIAVDAIMVGPLANVEFADNAVGNNFGLSTPLQAAVPVTAGIHAVDIMSMVSGASLIFIRDRAITTLFVPFGDLGLIGILRPTMGSYDSSINERQP